MGYDLYYWPVPFRGEFVRAILAFAGTSWTEHGPDEIAALMARGPAGQPVGFMGPPVLIDGDPADGGLALSQMPAIALHLGERLGLLHGGVAMTAKVVGDANDVLDEITLDGGRLMWTLDTWVAFVPRLKRWMAIFEAVGARHGLHEDGGFLLGTAEAGVADIVTATLWGTMGDRFPALAAMLAETAPRTATLVGRMRATPALAARRARAEAEYGDAYCGGEIEKSLRRVVG